mmetsp:Transcript_51543/g.143997  ORF Transcript_51543/g.143997 Transcript_51543/m.143997 type:complete len:264 (-) Transcript_51543:21-812(-)
MTMPTARHAGPGASAAASVATSLGRRAMDTASAANATASAVQKPQRAGAQGSSSSLAPPPLASPAAQVPPLLSAGPAMGARKSTGFLTTNCGVAPGGGLISTLGTHSRAGDACSISCAKRQVASRNTNNSTVAATSSRGRASGLGNTTAHLSGLSHNLLRPAGAEPRSESRRPTTVRTPSRQRSAIQADRFFCRRSFGCWRSTTSQGHGNGADGNSAQRQTLVGLLQPAHMARPLSPLQAPSASPASAPADADWDISPSCEGT